jgi:hypothetical protein
MATIVLAFEWSCGRPAGARESMTVSSYSHLLEELDDSLNVISMSDN